MGRIDTFCVQYHKKDLSQPELSWKINVHLAFENKLIIIPVIIEDT